jgi:hypothetical protein
MLEVEGLNKKLGLLAEKEGLEDEGTMSGLVLAKRIVLVGCELKTISRTLQLGVTRVAAELVGVGEKVEMVVAFCVTEEGL